MELTRGVCFLCLDSNRKVLSRLGAQEYIELIPKLIGLTNSEFQNQMKFAKMCPSCAHKIVTLDKTREIIAENLGKTERKCCKSCFTHNDLVRVGIDYQYFQDKSQGICNYDISTSPLVCLSCFYYIDTLHDLKMKLNKKFPQLCLVTPTKQSPLKQTGTPRRKSTSETTPPSKKRKIFDNCFTYLQTLSTDNYKVDRKLRKDNRLYRKIAYVKLFDETPSLKTKICPSSKDLSRKVKPHPMIKIKLKMKNQAKVPKTATKHLSKRFSTPANDSRIENADETPKSIIKTPRRRPSLFAVPIDENRESSEEKSDEKSTERDAKATDSISEIVDEYINNEIAAKQAEHEVINENDETSDEDVITLTAEPNEIEENIQGDAENAKDNSNEKGSDEEDESREKTQKEVTNQNEGDEEISSEKEAGSNPTENDADALPEDESNGDETIDSRVPTPSLSEEIDEFPNLESPEKPADYSEEHKNGDAEYNSEDKNDEAGENGLVQDKNNDDRDTITLDELYGDLRLDQSDVNDVETLFDADKKKKRVTFSDDI